MSEIKATVFIPTYYGEDNLDELFGSLIKQKTNFEYEILVVQIQVHTRVIYQSGFMQVDVKTIGRFHLQRGLYACR